MKNLILIASFFILSISYGQEYTKTQADSTIKFDLAIPGTPSHPSYCWWSGQQYPYIDFESLPKSQDTSSQTTITPDTLISIATWDSILLTPPPIIDPWGGWQPWPPPYEIIVDPWIQPFEICWIVWTPQQREAGNANRIFSYQESSEICLEVLQQNGMFNIKLQALENQIINFKLRELESRKLLGSAHLSIPIAIKAGVYEWNAIPSWIKQGTYVLETNTSTASLTSRILSDRDDSSTAACEVRTAAINTYNSLHNIDNYEVCTIDSIY